MGKCRLAGGIALVLLVLVPCTAYANLGDRFSFAPVEANGTSAPAFPSGPDARAFWAGTCDLFAGDFIVGADPGTPFPNCIEQRGAVTSDALNSQLHPPLAPGTTPGTSGSDGWKPNNVDVPTSGPSWRLDDVTQAGAHPDGSVSFWFSRAADEPINGVIGGVRGAPDGAPRNVRVSLPPGVIGNPNAVPKCPAEALEAAPAACPPKTQVGVSTVGLSGRTGVFAVYNVEPREGKTAEFVISGVGISTLYGTNVSVVARARTDDDFGADASAVELPSAVPVHGQTFTFWGVPWAESHDRYRPVSPYCHALTEVDPFGTNAWLTPGGMPVRGLPGGSSAGCSQEPVHYDPSWGPIRPFLTVQSDCSRSSSELTTSVVADNYNSGVVATADALAPQADGCAQVPFGATFDLEATSTRADSATGLDVTLAIPQNNTPPSSVRFNPDDDTGAPAYWKSTGGLATSHLDQTVVTLPDGVSVNPASASGLEACSDSQIGLTQLGDPPRFNDSDPFDGDFSDGVECPPGSVIGIAEVRTPLLEEILTGEVVLGTPKSTDPQSGQMFRLFLVVRNRERGVIAKVFGSTVADPGTGQLTATFSKNPRLPFDELNLKMKGGDRGLLALQQRCSSRQWSAALTPWSGNPAAQSGGAFSTDSNCGFGFQPSLRAGLSNRQGGGTGSFSFNFTRADGEQWFRGLTARLPTGLLASVRDVPLCTKAQANAGACPAASRIGAVDAGAGSGFPFFLERKGDLYLTEGYKGGAYGLAVVVPVEAGPFRGPLALTPIVVRQAIHVDRTTAAVTAISDPFPHIWHGIPLRVREVTVSVDRTGFMRAPTSCAPKQVGADFLSTEDALSRVDQPFQVSNCGALRFKPRLALRLTGRRQTRTGEHPGVRAVVRQGSGEAGIKRAEVRLPSSLALDPNNAQALCEFADGTKPEPTCPKGSIVGRARAVSPLLKNALTGNVYFVKNVERNPVSGALVRKLPMLVVALRGEIAVNLRGRSNATRDGRLVNTFSDVPDAPVSRFNLNIRGGRNGILAVTQRSNSVRIDVCRGRHLAEVDTDGQNGRRHDFDVLVDTPRCRNKARTSCRTAKQRRRKACHQRAAAQRAR